jgi:hypothetical protein
MGRGTVLLCHLGKYRYKRGFNEVCYLDEVLSYDYVT